MFPRDVLIHGAGLDRPSPATPGHAYDNGHAASYGPTGYGPTVLSASSVTR